jgi:hypothetical protein
MPAHHLPDLPAAAGACGFLAPAEGWLHVVTYYAVVYAHGRVACGLSELDSSSRQPHYLAWTAPTGRFLGVFAGHEAITQASLRHVRLAPDWPGIPEFTEDTSPSVHSGQPGRPASREV